MRIAPEHLLAVSTAAFLSAFVFLGVRAQHRFQLEWRERPYTRMARFLNTYRSREECDLELAVRRELTSTIVDRFRSEIRALWNERGSGNEPAFSLLDLGKIKLRVNPKVAPQSGFDRSAWSWDEAYSLILRTQQNPNHPDNQQRWRDIDSMVRYLMEKDIGRQVQGRKYLPPEATEHSFRPNPEVRRTGAREFTVRLQPGDFAGHEGTLQKLLQDEWQGNGWKVKIVWSPSASYRMLAHSNSSRSFVNHRKKTMEIANLAWTKTVAHELGHILGFDDHYYNVWNARNCYYSQESRLADIMSNSEKGRLTPRHWELLDKAYPLGAVGPSGPFSYTY